jgi:hypothetical protein
MYMFKANAAVRKEIDSATVTTDASVDMQEVCQIARDSRLLDGISGADYTTIIAEIPEIILSGKSYRVVSGCTGSGVDLIGKRGGYSCLVRNLKNPTLWAHNTMSGYRCRSIWYRRNADGTFSQI